MTTRDEPRKTPPAPPRKPREWILEERPSGYESRPLLVVAGCAGDAGVM